MVLYLLAFLGGALTIASPCILPVLPFVFARADRPFVSNGLPMLAGMAATFALVASLAAVGGGWAVEANAVGRGVALALLAAFGLTLLFPQLADRVTAPLVRLGDRLSQSADASRAAKRIYPSWRRRRAAPAGCTDWRWSARRPERREDTEPYGKTPRRQAGLNFSAAPFMQ